MRIGLILGSTLQEKNALLSDTLKKVADKYGHEVVNFGVFEDESNTYSYTEVAVLAALLINSGVIDFIVTGCSSGQGMNLALNTMPGILSGYLPTPQDAFLFGRINEGNAASLPLGLGFGWLGELNLEYTLDKLFDGDFGIGYPPESAERKIRDTKVLHRLNKVAKKDMVSVLRELDCEFLQKILSKRNVVEYIVENALKNELTEFLRKNV